MTWQVRTPVQGYTGEVCGIPFYKGEALVPDSAVAALQFFRRRGYGLKQIEESGTPADTEFDAEAGAEPGAHGFDPDFAGRPKAPEAERAPAADGADPEPGPRPTSKSSKDEWAAYVAAELKIPLEEAAAKSLKDLKALLETHEQETKR